MKTEVSKEQQNVIFQNQNLKQHKKTLKVERSRKLAAMRQTMEEALGLDTSKDATSATVPEKAEKHDLPKPDVVEMEEEEEANGDDCFTNPDPSSNIELDFA